MKELQIICSRSEIGAGRRGASLGIDGLRFAAIKSDPSFFRKNKIDFADHRNDILEEEIEFEHAKRLPILFDVFEKLATKVSTHSKAGKNIIVLAGDHSSAAATIAGLKMAYPEKRLGVIWIDAHADLHTPFTSPSGNVHGMPLSISLAEDNKEESANDPEDAVKTVWDQMKNLGGIQPKIKSEDIRFIALRSYEKQEESLIKKYNMQYCTVEELRETGAASIASQTLESLKHCDWIYVSFDVDSMDPSVSSGTGTPVPGGLSQPEAKELCTLLVKDEKVNCFEITEINPILDTENKMAENAFDILKSVHSNI